MTDKDNNVEYNNDLPYADKNVGNIDDIELDIPDVPELSDEQLKDYQQIFEKTGWDKFKAFIKAENKWGRRAKVFKDFALTFIPYGRTIRNTSEMATEILTDNKKTMLNSKKWYKSKTIWSAILIVVIAILQALGVDLAANPELTATIFEVAMLLAGAFGLYGLRDAIDKQGDKYTNET